MRYDLMPDNHILGMGSNAEQDYVVKTLSDIIYWCRREKKAFEDILKLAQAECDVEDKIERDTNGTFGIVPLPEGWENM